MRPSSRLLRALSIASVAVALVAQVRSPTHAAAVLGWLAVVLAVGPRISAGTGAQIILMGFSALAAVFVAQATALGDDDGRPRLVEGFAMAATALFAAASVRRAVKATFGDVRADFAFDAFALVACAQVRLHPVALGAVGAWLLSSLLALRTEGGASLPLRRLPRRNLAALSLMVVVTAGLSVGAVQGLREFYGWVSARMIHALEDDVSSGFDDRFDLGALSTLLQSEELVLRVQGPAPEHLRGSTFDRYQRGRWRSSRGFAHRIVRVPRGPIEGDGVISIERVGGVGGWYFLPLETGRFATEEGGARLDPLGTVRAIPGDPGHRWWVTLGPRDALAPDPPTARDTEVPEALVDPLRATARAWAGGARGNDDTMSRLTDNLRARYRYSLRFARGRTDPVLDFLYVHREGHCEYFASALALLGRTMGVPTRVVGGYRVAERNPYTNEWMVREMNAHAWVEAWGDDHRWHTWDATPSDGLPQNQRHQTERWRGLREAVTYFAAAVQRWVLARTAWQMLGAAGVMLAVWLVYRRFQPPEGASVVGLDPRDLPTPAWTALETALGSRGITRAKGETLERFAARVRESALLDADSRDGAGRAIEGYAAWRYGNVGDEESVRASLDGARTALRAAKPTEG